MGASTDLIDVSEIESMEDDDAPLYLYYSGEFKCQPAYVRINQDGVVDAFGNPNIGAGSFNEFHKVEFWISITPEISGEALVNIVTREDVMALFERVYLGHTVEWDGSNERGTLDDDAQDALDDLCYIFGEVEPDICVYNSVGEAMFAGEPPTLNLLLGVWEEGDVEEAAEEWEETSGYIIKSSSSSDLDVEEALLEAASSLFYDDTPGLSDNHLNSLIKHNYITSDEAAEYMEK